MSNMSESDNNFETLRQMLALKRHEVPPPGYFEDFSGNVMARIRSAEATQRLPWLLRFLQAFEARPAYPVAFASTLCLLLLYGIVSVEQNPAPSFEPMTGSSAFSVPSMSSDAPATGQQLLAIVSTNPPVDISGNTSIFSSQSSPYFQQVSFSPTAN